MAYFVCVILCVLIFSGAKCQETSEDMQVKEVQQEEQHIFLSPKSLENVPEETVQVIQWHTTYPDADHASVEAADETIAEVIFYEETFYNATAEKNETGKGSFNVSTIFLGITYINFTIYDKDNNVLGSKKIALSVNLSYANLNNIFTYVLTAVIFVVYVNMGATIDLNIVKTIVRKPIGPLLGIICQYGFRPLAGFALAKLFFPNDELKQLGMFLLGASPGGGSSNMWTLLLGGSLDLSIMMTFASTIAAFGALPLWVLTLGSKIIGSESNFEIPYLDVFYIILSLLIPCGIGLLIQFFAPKVAKFLEVHVLKKLSLFNVIFILTAGVYSYRYIFKIFTFKIVLANFSLPVVGYAFGFFLAYIVRRPFKEVIAISIETGIQNANIALIILKYTLGPTVGNLAVVMPVCNVLMTPIPLFIALIIKKLYECFASSGGANIKSIDEPKKQDEIQVYTVTQPEPKEVHQPQENSNNGPASKPNGVENPGIDLSYDVV